MRREPLALAFLALASCDGGTPSTVDAGGRADVPDAGAVTVSALPVTQTFTFAGLDGSVDVAVDAYGWSHVRATTLHDAMFVQGYLQARERMPQMDILRRLASGTLGERFGVVAAAAVESDLAFRVVGLRRAAQAMWTNLQGGANVRTRASLESFSAGVNEYLRELRAREIEQPPDTSLVLDETTADWTPVDSLAIGRYQSYSLSYTADRDVARSSLLDQVHTVFGGADPVSAADRYARRAAGQDLLVWRAPSSTAVVPDFAGTQPGMRDTFLADTRRAALSRSVYANAATFFARVHEGFSWWGDDSRGSNNWVITPGITRNHHAVLANDPHLSLRSPAIWWGTHLTVTAGADATDVAGTTFPGVPGVVIGFNDRVAWGVTTAYYDVSDAYRETITAGANGGPDTVLFNGAQVPLTVIHEAVSDGAGGTIDAAIEVVPHHGPLVPTIRNGRIAPRTGGTAISVRWTGAQPTDETSVFLALCYARSADQARAAVAGFGVGAQNFVFADLDGNTGYASRAVVPVRAAGALSWRRDNPTGANPCTVLPGTGEAEWTGTLADAQIPQATGSPSRPFIVTANNDQVGSTFDGNPFDAPTYLSCDYASGWRAERITQRLTDLHDQIAVEDMISVQSDHRVLAAGRLRPFLAMAFSRLEAEWAAPGTNADLRALATALLPHQARMRDAAMRLQAWSLDGASGMEDGATDAQRTDAVATTIFHAWLSRAIRETFGDELSALGGPSIDGVRVLLNLLEHAPELAARDTSGESVLWDDLGTTTATESKDLILLRSLDDALGDLATLTSATDPTRWLWGPLHTVRFTTFIPTTDRVLSIPAVGDAMFPNGFPRAGGVDVVDASTPGLGGSDYSYGSGPSQRYSVEMGPDGPRAFNALPGGQTIDHTSTHFRDEAAFWQANRVHAVPFRERDVASSSAGRLRFDPRR